MLARAATAAPRAPEDAGVDALRAGIAGATAGGGTRVRLARVPWAAEGGPASAVVLDPASPATATAAAPPDENDMREVAEMIAALPQTAAALRSPAAMARTVDRRHDRAGTSTAAAAAAAERLSRAPAAAEDTDDAADSPQPSTTPGRDEDASDRGIDALYDRLAARLRADLLDDRERRGDHLQRWPG